MTESKEWVAVQYSRTNGFSTTIVGPTIFGEEVGEDASKADVGRAIAKAEQLEDKCWHWRSSAVPNDGVGIALFRPSTLTCEWDGMFVVRIGKKMEFVFTKSPADTMDFWFNHAMKIPRLAPPVVVEG